MGGDRGSNGPLESFLPWVGWQVHCTQPINFNHRWIGWRLWPCSPPLCIVMVGALFTRRGRFMISKISMCFFSEHNTKWELWIHRFKPFFKNERIGPGHPYLPCIQLLGSLVAPELLIVMYASDVTYSTILWVLSMYRVYSDGGSSNLSFARSCLTSIQLEGMALYHHSCGWYSLTVGVLTNA